MSAASSASMDRATARRLLVISNPTAGSSRRRRLARVVAELETLGCEARLRETSGPGDAARLAREAGADFDVLVAAGGDGTIAEVLNGLMARPDVIAGGGPALGVIPLGTANVLAGELGLPREAAALAAYLAQGGIRRIRLGRLEQGPAFAAMVGAGFDATVVAGVNLTVKRWLGKGAYALAAARLWFRPQVALRVTVDGAVHEAASVIVSKGRFYAGRFVIAPAARLDDGVLHVCLFARDGPIRRLIHGLAMARGRLDRLADVKLLKAQEILIDGPSGTPLQGDGDIIAHLPVTVRLNDKPTPLLYPVTYSD